MALLAGGNNLGIIPPNCMVALASTFPENWILYFKKKFLLYGEKLRLSPSYEGESKALCRFMLWYAWIIKKDKGFWRLLAQKMTRFRWPAHNNSHQHATRLYNGREKCSNQTLRKRFDRSLEDPLNSYLIFFPHVLTILVLLLLLLFFNEENNIVNTASTLSTYQEYLFMQMMKSLKRSLSFPKFIQHLLRNVG